MMTQAHINEQDGYQTGRYEFACFHVEGASVLDLATGPGYGAEIGAPLPVRSDNPVDCCHIIAASRGKKSEQPGGGG